MANNRMYLRCKGCGETFFLGKRFGGGYFIQQYEEYKGVPLMDRLNEFYDVHEWCGNEGLDCFELIYEDTPAPVTNADRIRAKSVEELAKWIVDDGHKFGKEYEGYMSLLDWLKQEASNDKDC